MEEKDYIKELFKDRFNDFEANVDPKLWDKIESEIAEIPQGSSSVGGSSIGKTFMWVAAVSITTVSTIAYTYWNGVDNEPIAKQNLEQLDSEVVVEDEISNSTPEKVEFEKQEKEEVSVKSSSDLNRDAQKVSTKNNEVKEVKEVNDAPQETSTKVISNATIAESSKSPGVDIAHKEAQNVISKAPSSIDIQSQSRVVASPMGGSAPLDVTFNSISSVKNIKWQFDDGDESIELAPNHTYSEPGIYFVTMMAELEDGTVVMDKAVIEVKESVKEMEAVAESSIFVPNIFTPNGDSENDRLSVKVKNVDSYTISIYCVNGRLVFTSDNPEEQWDGRDQQGNVVEEGVYYYLINAIGENNNVYAPKGYITVRR